MKKQSIILIIDDNLNNVKVIVDNLNYLGHTTIVARNGEMGLQRAKYAKPDLILLDVMMPGMDGFETCRQLKADPNTAHIPVLFMTALHSLEDKMKGFEVGGVDYITKPVQVEELVARVKAHLTIRYLQQDLQQQVDELKSFTHTVAHDLKNPLGVIVSYLDYTLSYLDTTSTEILRYDLTQVKQTGEKTISIVSELLLLSSVQSQQVAVTPIIMEDVLWQVMRRLDLEIKKCNGKIILPELWTLPLGYQGWLEEVWINYLSNGLKYGGNPPVLKIGTREEGNMVRYWVEDNGPGLTVIEQNQLFVEFSRVHQGKIDGHGLGLSIVKRIIDKLGGEVGVESIVGKGSTFYFTLPKYNGDDF